MGRDLTGVIIFAKDEDSAYKKGRKIFKKLVREEALLYFLTYDDFDKHAGHYCHEFPAMEKLSRAMLVDKKTNTKGYQFVRGIIRGDEANGRINKNTHRVRQYLKNPHVVRYIEI